MGRWRGHRKHGLLGAMKEEELCSWAEGRIEVDSGRSQSAQD